MSDQLPNRTFGNARQNGPTAEFDVWTDLEKSKLLVNLIHAWRQRAYVGKRDDAPERVIFFQTLGLDYAGQETQEELWDSSGITRQLMQ